MRQSATIALATLTVIAALSLLVLMAEARRSGSPAGYTGAPAVSGNTCTSCHSGTANSGPGSVLIESQSVYAPGSVIPVAVTLTNMQNASRNGFQAAAYEGTTLLTGWASPDADTSVSGDHLNQTSAGSAKGSWLAYLQTPGTAKTFTIYTSGLDADGAGGTSNDRTYTASRQLTPGTVNLSLMTLPRLGTVVPLALDAPTDALKAYHLAASFSNTGIQRGQRTIPLANDALMVITGGNLWPHVFRNYVGFLGSQGTATANLAVPNDASLVGLTLYHAFIVIDPNATHSISTISNGLAVTLY